MAFRYKTEDNQPTIHNAREHIQQKGNKETFINLFCIGHRERQDLSKLGAYGSWGKEGRGRESSRKKQLKNP